MDPIEPQDQPWHGHSFNLVFHVPLANIAFRFCLSAGGMLGHAWERLTESEMDLLSTLQGISV